MLEKMQTCRVLLWVFVTLLMCDFGMSSNSSLLSSESPTQNDTFNIFTASISITTAELTTPKTEHTTELKTADNTTTTLNTADNTTTNHHNVTVPSSNAIFSTPKSTKMPTTIIGKDSPGYAGYTGGIIILIFIIILIIILLGILYFLRKKGRSYSFDLTRTTAFPNEYVEPFTDLDQQVVSYEHKDKDLPLSVDCTQDDKSQEKSSPIANGCTGEKTEQTTASENEEQNLPEENSFPSSLSLTPPMKKVEFNLDLDDFMSGESEVTSPTSEDFCDVMHNENNNNISDAGRGTAEEIFTEINLDEPKEQP